MSSVRLGSTVLLSQTGKCSRINHRLDKEEKQRGECEGAEPREGNWGTSMAHWSVSPEYFRVSQKFFKALMRAGPAALTHLFPISGRRLAALPTPSHEQL